MEQQGLDLKLNKLQARTGNKQFYKSIDAKHHYR